MLQQFFPSERDYNAGFFLPSDQLLQDFFFLRKLCLQGIFFSKYTLFYKNNKAQI